MSLNPMKAGPLLVVPRQEVVHWDGLSPELCAHLLRVSQTLAKAQKRAFSCKRLGMLIVGVLEVLHAHASGTDQCDGGYSAGRAGSGGATGVIGCRHPESGDTVKNHHAPRWDWRTSPSLASLSGDGIKRRRGMETVPLRPSSLAM
ncbi:HIT domain-containing protein [Billgrantia montanilacus]|uniref:HIT domain-containing protein n=1 Tax=Billgrantia montanilacus TaxID=2282305 RepID=A0A368U0F2_9GAMM|nr:HIT domain-containing protein [Halomonas montanilacus]